jgi:DNA adenine methylase
LKSLLRYPGGKTRALKWITPYFPENLTEMVSPFFGGGSIEIDYASRGVRVFGYEIFEPLVNFWQNVLDDPEKIAYYLDAAYHPCSKPAFAKWQERQAWADRDDDAKYPHWKEFRACMYYALNRSSFSGATTSGGFSKESADKRFTLSSIDRLKTFSCSSLSVKEADFNDSLAKHDDDIFIYADPPYAIDNPVLYGRNGSTHEGFDHAGFAKAIKEKNNWIISYNDSKYIRELYKGYKIIKTGWSYGMHGGTAKKGDLTNTSSEIIILNGIDPDHIAAANDKVQEMRALDQAKLEKKRSTAKRKKRVADKKCRQLHWERKLLTFKKKKGEKQIE